MRWSKGLFAVLIGLILVTGFGCRQLSTENTDRNRAPETFLTAAPVDSVAGGGLTRIAHRYRAAWSGADIDGEVVGFFVAVTETTVDATSGRPFRLPPPRPSQYKFTTSRESLFVFSTLEGRGSDRQHALYVYAIDNQGRVDPTPAVTHFVARNPSLPVALFRKAEARGTIYVSDGMGGVNPALEVKTLIDSLELPIHPPIDTIAVGSSVHFEWKGTDPDFGSFITGYLYKLTETEFVRVDSSVTSADYGTGFGPSPGPLPIGFNTFRVRAIDESGGTSQPDGLRQFYVNYAPDTWFAGPDVSLIGSHLMTDSLGTYFPSDPITDQPLDFPGNPFGADTLVTLPAQRLPMDGLASHGPLTFLEGRTLLTRNLRWYVRQEGDTVAYTSHVVVRLGGFDKDSPYAVAGGTPNNPNPVLRTGPQNGSPTSFVARLAYRTTTGTVQTPFTTPFPNVDVLDPFNNPVVLFRVERVEAVGTGFLQARAIDGNRTADTRIGDPLSTYEDLSPALQSKVLVFPINFRPGLAWVSPLPNDLLDPPNNRITLVVRATDPDPDPLNSRPPGSNNGYNTMFFAIRARLIAPGEVLGPNEGWQDPVLGYYSPDVTTPGVYPYTAPITLELDVPGSFPDGPGTIEVEVVDNANRAQGRVITAELPFYWRVGP